MTRDPFSSMPGADDELSSPKLMAMNNCQEVHRAVQSVAAEDPENRRKIISRAAELHCSHLIPDDWKL